MHFASASWFAALAPASELYFPIAQSVHEVMAPLLSWYFPAAQIEHAVPNMYIPTPHPVQAAALVEPDVDDVPAVHGVHDD